VIPAKAGIRHAASSDPGFRRDDVHEIASTGIRRVAPYGPGLSQPVRCRGRTTVDRCKGKPASLPALDRQDQTRAAAFDLIAAQSPIEAFANLRCSAAGAFARPPIVLAAARDRAFPADRGSVVDGSSPAAS